MLARGCEELVGLILGEPLTVRRFSEYTSENFSRANIPIRQMLNASEFSIAGSTPFKQLPIITDNIPAFYDSLSRIIVPNLFFCVDQCENIFEQLQKFKLEPRGNLKKDQILSVLLYIYEYGRDHTHTLSYSLNRALLTSDTTFDRYLGLLRSAFSKLETTSSSKQTVYRGIFLNPENSVFIDPLKRLPEGAKFQWFCYSRCTRSLDLAKTYATPAGIILEIENALTLSFIEFGNIISDDELLLSPNALYTVTNKYHRIDQGYFVITLSAEQTSPF
jgi:hypothetical protein